MKKVTLFKRSIIMCLVATFICSCSHKSNTNSTATSSSAPSADTQQVTRVVDENHVQCGDSVCQYNEECKDNQCKTRFEMNVYLAPISKGGNIFNDSYDYWECQSETCTYHSERIYTIPKGIRVRENDVYCGGDGIELSKMKDYTCTELGWVCSSPNGCDCEVKERCRYNQCLMETCDPGEKCQSDGCNYIDGLRDTILCEEGDCECGTHRCGKNQICAHGNCYFGGEIRNGFGECEFSTSVANPCGTSDPPQLLLYYICPKQCPSAIPPKVKDGYEEKTYFIGDCPSIDFSLWSCTSENGCQCGDAHCLKDASCIDGQCVLFTGNTSTIDEWYNEEIVNECITEYPSLLSYQPKVFEHYHVVEMGYFHDSRYWACDDSNECICDGRKLPQNMICHGEKDNTEFMAYPPENSYSPILPAPKNTKNYKYDKINNKWMCLNTGCFCGDKQLPQDANCKNETIYCNDHEIPSSITGYQCNKEGTLHTEWVCPSGNCLCGGFELRPGVSCIHLNGNDYQCCGSDSNHRACYTAQTAMEHECIDGEWILKADISQNHCQNKVLPAGTRCSSLMTQSKNYYLYEEAVCGKQNLRNWDDYECENNRWKCALKDKPCNCNGKPLPDGARCIENEAYCGHDSRTKWNGLSCLEDKWVDETIVLDTSNNAAIIDESKRNLCFGHKLDNGVICPSSKGGVEGEPYLFVDDITMSNHESCEHVRGCFCHEKLCPPSGICTSNGCIDPLTDKPFETKDGYLVSGRLSQCENTDGCQCGEIKIEYRDYCYNDMPYISMKSCVSDKRRTIGENNYLSYDCNKGTAPWENICKPDPYVDPSQYIVRDCLISTQAWFSDRGVEHKPINVCTQKEGCQCIHHKCKYGEACYKGQCIADYPCHSVDNLDEEDELLGKCRPEDPRG